LIKKKKLQPPQKEILDLIEKNLSELNQIKIETVTKKTMKEVKKNEKDRQEISDSVIF
jgi:AAA+ ATPase superfamily predicted ATPase